MDIAAADSGPFDIDEDIVGRLERGDWPVFKLDTSSLFKNEREILLYQLAPLATHDLDGSCATHCGLCLLPASCLRGISGGT